MLPAQVKISEGKAFGLMEEAFIAHALLAKYQLRDMAAILQAMP
jgi:hypothetical protein